MQSKYGRSRGRKQEALCVGGLTEEALECPSFRERMQVLSFAEGIIEQSEAKPFYGFYCHLEI